MSNKYDIIVIGGGHNGLTAAVTLARKNKSVLLLEKREMPGGLAAGEEFYPGYRTTGLLHDTSGVRRKVIEALNLEKFGLNLEKSKPAISILSKDGRCLHLHGNVEEASNEIAKFSQKDALAYRKYRSFIDKISGFVNGLMDEIPPDMANLGGRQMWELAKKGIALKKLGKVTMMEFLKVAPMSVADFLNETFETDFIKAGIAAPAIYGSYTGPWSSYTTLNLLLWECAANMSITGGPQALVSALLKAAEHAGVKIKADAEVGKILLNDKRSVSGVKLSNGEEFLTPVVASSCTPRETFYELLRPNQINYAIEQGIKYFRSRGTTAKVNLAVDKAIHLNGHSSVEFARTGNSFDEMERAFDSVKYRQFSDEPVLDIHIPTVNDPSLAPPGHTVISIIVHFAPHYFDEGWSDITKDKLLNSVVRTLEQYAPDLSSSIVGSEVMSPVDLEEKYSLTNGHIFHGEHAVDQLITRPIPSCARYKTPVEGLYLCGSGSHPGGGITCMPGYLGASMILK
jgi:phytoene dehydrogenase-like protein